MDSQKRITQIVCVALAIQIVMMLFTQNIWITLLPVLVVSVPAAYFAMRSLETVQLMVPHLARNYLGVTIAICLVIATFVFLDKLRFDLQLIRILFADVVIFWAASILGVQAAVLRRRA